jgi:nucleoside-diphosphate-sugar epimerase
MMKYFVTGATGFVGSRVAQLLREEGHEVVAIARNPLKAESLTTIGIDVRPGDITDRASLRGPMSGADGIFHIASWYKVGQRNNRDGVRINVDGSRNVLETMRELGIPKGVYTSTLAVNSDTRGQMVDETYRFTGRHLSEYDRTKAVAHHDIAVPMMRAGLPLVIVMPGAIYGPNDTSATGDLMRQYLDGKLKMVPRGVTLCWAHVDDIARGHLLAMEKGIPGEEYIIAGPEHTIEDLFRRAELISGIPAPKIMIPAAAMSGMAKTMGVVERLIPVPETYSGEYLRIAAGVTYLGDNSKARRKLGYKPRSLDEGLRATFTAAQREAGTDTR